ncbi:MAG: AAA family ATPase, partial [Dehalococcoidales bacterium]|nr:AAA family ATPase [Dehalococcoidales bacterium]
MVKAPEKPPEKDAQKVDAPEVKRVGDCFKFSWLKLNVEILVDHLYESSHGETYAEVKANTMTGDHIYRGRLNMLSPAGKATLARQLRERLELDWLTIIEQIAETSLSLFRQGEPMIDLAASVQDKNVTPYMCWPFLRWQEPTIFFGDGGSGKTTFALALLMSLQTGLPLLHWVPAQRVNTAILDYESSGLSTLQTLRAINEGMQLGVAEEDFPKYRHCDRSLIHDISEIQRMVMENNIQLLLIDSAGMASGGDAERQEFACQYWRAIRSLGVATITIHHKPKESDTIFGSNYWFNEARGVWMFKKEQESGREHIDVGLFHKKAS